MRRVLSVYLHSNPEGSMIGYSPALATIISYKREKLNSSQPKLRIHGIYQRTGHYFLLLGAELFSCQLLFKYLGATDRFTKEGNFTCMGGTLKKNWLPEQPGVFVYMAV